jgi:hypothetical protein
LYAKQVMKVTHEGIEVELCEENNRIFFRVEAGNK